MPIIFRKKNNSEEISIWVQNLKAMGAESKLKAAPKVVKLNKALKLAESWVSSMSGSTTEEHNQLDFVGRPPRLGLGAKETPKAKSEVYDPVERKLLGKLHACKKSSIKDARKGNIVEESVDSEEEDDDDEPQSRTNAFAKKRALPPITTPQSKKQK
ncbi:uncharacterized protein LOC109837353 isoform X2 [Asparagus officinalis]|uniref:uncharacterized protein LOC109837353 isoform X2 n=1 Tax=Asparagus officinalis TaxID=4686 RepID=UPI00098E4A9F|nr:uncharacterized protein LOC109837353 isoform X2 [Asparagus officinalis]XP_020261150.1 uncharacterized protein LOC109837353 isoform X2 [Asparagus officinalis]